MTTLHKRGRAARAPIAALALVGALVLAGCQTMPNLGSAPAGLIGGLSLGPSAGSASSSGTFGGVRDVLEGAQAAFKDYSADEQRRLGADFASVLLGARPLLRNEAVQRYVNQVGWWVAMQAEKPKDKDGREIAFAWRFGVIDTDAVNAYATPGGFVFVTVGLLRRLNSEAELAGVLGHEIAHVTQGHYLAALKKGGFAQIAGGVVQARTGGNAISGAMLGAVKNLYAKGLDRGDEFDADRWGMLYAARAGYAPGGLPSVLRMYAQQSAQAGKDENFNLFFATHPDPGDRITRLDALVSARFASAAHTANEARYQAIRRQLGAATP